MDDLQKRGKALEDMFFKRQDDALLAKMKADMQAAENRASLAAAAGLDDAATLDALLKIGVTPESLTSVALIPLVAVAWADGKMEAAEKKAILDAAAQSGIESGSASFTLLEGWLANQPGSELLASWKDYIGAIKADLEESAFGQLKSAVIGRARTVAESAGGFLGLGNKISDVEEKVIADLTSAF